jgi:hypothetical protein
MSNMGLVIYTNLIKKIFVLEDDPSRIKWFQQKFCMIPLVKIMSMALPAKKELHNQKYDLIFLDHDLDNDVYVDSHEDLDAIQWNTGYQVMKGIPLSVNKDTPVIIHSLNTVGAANMLKCRPECTTYIPFTTLRFNTVITDNESH